RHVAAVADLEHQSTVAGAAGDRGEVRRVAVLFVEHQRVVDEAADAAFLALDAQVVPAPGLDRPRDAAAERELAAAAAALERVLRVAPAADVEPGPVAGAGDMEHQQEALRAAELPRLAAHGVVGEPAQRRVRRPGPTHVAALALPQRAV